MEMIPERPGYGPGNYYRKYAAARQRRLQFGEAKDATAASPRRNDRPRQVGVRINGVNVPRGSATENLGFYKK